METNTTASPYGVGAPQVAYFTAGTLTIPAWRPPGSVTAMVAPGGIASEWDWDAREWVSVGIDRNGRVIWRRYEHLVTRVRPAVLDELGRYVDAAPRPAQAGAGVA